jgi:ABC-type metal ion transport system substrate-binding protein
MNKKAYLADHRNKKSEGNIYVVREIGERQEGRKNFEQYYHNQQTRPAATTRPKTLPMRLL